VEREQTWEPWFAFSSSYVSHLPPRPGVAGLHGLLDTAVASQLPVVGRRSTGGVDRPDPMPSGSGPRTRARARAAASEATEASPQASDRTAVAVRALLAEGAPWEALQLLTSDGVCDSPDRTVLV